MSINTVSVSGNCTRDAELRTTKSGTSVLNFSIAVNERRKGASGEWEDYPNYVDCVLFGRRAESIARYITKGTKVMASGRLHQDRWEDRETGRKRSQITVTVEDIDWTNSRAVASSERDVVSDNFPGASVYENDDIPF